MKKYFIIIGWLIMTVLVFGYVSPMLISSKSDVLVATGFLIIGFVWVPLSYGIYKKLTNSNETIGGSL